MLTVPIFKKQVQVGALWHDAEMDSQGRQRPETRKANVPPLDFVVYFQPMRFATCSLFPTNRFSPRPPQIGARRRRSFSPLPKGMECFRADSIMTPTSPATPFTKGPRGVLHPAFPTPVGKNSLLFMFNTGRDPAEAPQLLGLELGSAWALSFDFSQRAGRKVRFPRRMILAPGC